MGTKKLTNVDYSESMDSVFVNDGQKVRQVKKSNLVKLLGMEMSNGVVFKGKDTTSNIIAKEQPSVGDKWFSTDENVYYMYSSNGWVNVGSGEDYSNIMSEFNELKESLGNVNEEISGLKGVGSGLTTEQKRYIVSLFKSAVYSENMSDMVTALENSFNTIPATGIKLSPTTLKFSGIGDTQKITATLTPDTATSSILWESDNTDVVTVKDGVATAVSDGIATITATSGSAIAKCSVTVNTKELYSVSNKVCNADFYEATGLKFGSDSANGYNKSWTLFANFSTKESTSVGGTNSEINVFQFVTNGANNGPGIWCRNGFSATKYPEGDHANWCFVITHDAYSDIITVYEYIEEVLKTKNVSPGYNKPNNSCYAGELYMGGVTSATYVGTIYDFSIIMRQMTSEEITTLLKGGVY